MDDSEKQKERSTQQSTSVEGKTIGSSGSIASQAHMSAADWKGKFCNCIATVCMYVYTTTKHHFSLILYLCAVIHTH